MGCVSITFSYSFCCLTMETVKYINENCFFENLAASKLEIDQYIGLPIFFPIFKHFTIIGYRFWKKNDNRYINIYIFFVTYTIIQSTTSSEMCSLYLTHPSTHTHLEQWTHTHKHTHTWSSGHTHTHTHVEQWTHTHTHLEQWTHTHLEQWTHTHTWSSGHTHTWSSGHIHTHTHLEQWTHTHTPGAVDTHTPGAVDTYTHTHLEQWTRFTQEKLQHGHRM